APKYPNFPSEIPAQFKPVTDSFDYERREVMIPMRDGVRLHTVILVPKGAKGAPILLTRTPYKADNLTGHADSPHLGPVLQGYDNATDVIVEDGYIRVVQDVRGKHGSEGDYVMTRPMHGPLNPTPVDHSTDTYDTIDWLVKNVPETNGKVGIIGISYDGFLPLMALVHPHPALKVSVPMNPMVDGWMGDDWFHNGAFRQQGLPYIHDQEATRESKVHWWSGHYDDYDEFLEGGSAGEVGRRAWSRLDSGKRSSSIPAMTSTGAIRPSIESSPPSPYRCPPCWLTACGTRRISTEPSRFTRPSSQKTRTMTGCFSCWDRGITVRGLATEARWAR